MAGWLPASTARIRGPVPAPETPMCPRRLQTRTVTLWCPRNPPEAWAKPETGGASAGGTTASTCIQVVLTVGRRPGPATHAGSLRSPPPKKTKPRGPE